MAGGNDANKMFTAQSVIDAIITQSIGVRRDPNASDPNGLQKQAAAMQARSNEEAAKRAVSSRSPSVKSTEAVINGPSDHESTSRPGSRPPSHDQQPTKLTPEIMEQIMSKDLSITPASSSAVEDFVKKRVTHVLSAATLTPTSAASAMVPPRSTAGSDERQITRVAQPVSPAAAPSSAATSSRLATTLEVISTPMPVSVAAASATVGPDAMARFIEAKKRLQEQQQQPLPVRLPLASGPGAQPNGEDQPPPGMSPLDYVKNKIVEEMKKHGEGEEPAPGGDQLPAGQKRLSPTHDGSDKSPNKKAKLDEEQAAPPPPIAAAVLPPDSPGSPGEMVIDESGMPDSGQKSPAVLCAPPAATAPTSTASTAEAKSSSAASLSTATSTASSTAPPPLAAIPTATTAASTASSTTAPRYEPLSDDE